MPSQIAVSMLKKKQNSQPIGAAVEINKGPNIGGDSHPDGHPHLEQQHEEMDRQHAFESAREGLQSLSKENMPGAQDLLKQLEKNWAGWVGRDTQAKPMEPTTKMSHKASPVSKSSMDEQDQNLAGDDVDLSQEA
jgi:hypothetical protein